MSKHTPGPWKWDGDVWNYDKKEEAPWLIDTMGSPVPILGGTIRCAKEADARLIAAAPELLDALRAMIAWVNAESGTYPCGYTGALVASAIAKATGETK